MAVSKKYFYRQGPAPSLLDRAVGEVCVRDYSGKPTATRHEWRGLETESPTRQKAGHAQNIKHY